MVPLYRYHTGIRENVEAICLDAVKAAKERNLTVSCDLNFRKNLWSSEKAEKAMED